MPRVSHTSGVVPEENDAEFSVSTSLPPMVSGALAGEIELSVPYLHPKLGAFGQGRPRHTRERSYAGTESLFAVRIQWWGESGPGTVLKPGVLEMRDKDGDRARRAVLSDATCALFPVRCGLDGLVAYLKDMGQIALEVLVHEGDAKGARQVGRCIVPVGDWDGQLRARSGRRESNVVAEGYFPVASIHGQKHAGDLCVRLRACLGPSSRLRRVLEAARTVVNDTEMRGEKLKKDNALATKDEAANADRSIRAMNHAKVRNVGKPRSGTGTQGPPIRGKSAGELPPQASFDSDDLSNTSSAQPPANRLPRGSAPLSSFQLNEALAKFDESDALPVWPTPKGSLYQPPETHGEAPPTPRHSERLASTRGRLAASARLRATRKPTSAAAGGGRDPRSLLSRSDIGSRGRRQGPAPRRESTSDPQNPVVEKSGSFAPTSISPERQAPDANPERSSIEQGRASCGNSRSSSDDRIPQKDHDKAEKQATDELRHQRAYLAQLLNRGKELREKMAKIASVDHSVATTATRSDANDRVSTPQGLGTSTFAEVTPPGLAGGALLGSSLRHDIEGIFDTLSDSSAAAEDIGMTVRDPETRGHEDRVVNLLLEAAGPPPSSLAFPALAEVERRRADSLAQVRFLRIRISRLVMFGSMTSAPEGHGWQLRFRLPAFAMPPARGRSTARASGLQSKGAKGEDVPGVRVISLPLPARTPTSSHAKGRAMGRLNGRSKSSSAGSKAGSMLRARRGCGAADLVVGETTLLEEIVCAVNVDDACVRRWMDSVLEFLLVDGRTDGIDAQHLEHQQQRKQQRKQSQSRAGVSSTVGPGDRVAAVAALPLRDLMLSAELAVATTLDLTEVVDFWATEDARLAATGRRGRGGRPLRNPYRSDSASAARPLVLGERAIGALAVGMELVPGEAARSPEHSRSEQGRMPSVLGRRIKQGVELSRHGAVEGRRRDCSADQDGRHHVEPEETDMSVSGSADGVQDPNRNVTLSSPVRVRRDRNTTAEDKTMKLETQAESQETVRDKNGEVDWRSTRDEQLAMPDADSLVQGDGKEGTKALPPASFLPSGSKRSEDGMAMLLRVEGLTLTSDAKPDIEHVRVAYSFTQDASSSSATVEHRSIRGFRPPLYTGLNTEQPGSVFTLQHKEIIIVSHSDAQSLDQNFSRVFEVWGSTSATEGRLPPRTNAQRNATTERTEQSSQNGEILLGLAKVPTSVSSASNSYNSTTGIASSDPGRSALVTAVDGPVSVIDPFSGRAVGALRILVVLGGYSEVRGLFGTNPREDPVEADPAAGTPPGRMLDSTNGRGPVQEELRLKEAMVGSADTESDGGRGHDVVNTLVRGEGRAVLPVLDDSVSELSMLLNPTRSQEPTTEPTRSSGGFTGLVRHVVELCAIGELPLAMDAADPAERDAGDEDAPVGCAIEYTLPSVGYASLDFRESGDVYPDPASTSDHGQKHELWWDADSGILNSRARHSVKLPSGILEIPPKISGNDSEDRSLNQLLDCMFGSGDLRLSLYWSAAGTTGKREPRSSSNTADAEQKANVESEIGQVHKRRFMGTAVLRRADLLPLVRKSSARTILKIPIESSSGRNDDSKDSDRLTKYFGDRSIKLSVPESLSLSVSYRREPSAVARRKSRGWVRQRVTDSVGDDGKNSVEAGDIGPCSESQTKAFEAPFSDSTYGGRGQDKIEMDGLGPHGSEGKDGTGAEEEGGVETMDTLVKTRKSVDLGDGSKGDGETRPSGSLSGIDSADSGSELDSSRSSSTLIHRSSRTEHLLPAYTTVCIRIDSIEFVRHRSILNSVSDRAERDADSASRALWASFAFPERRDGQLGERDQMGEEEGGFVREEYWSKAVSAVRQGGVDRVPLGWCVEVPVTIDAAFVRYVHTQSLLVRIWSGYTSAWPTEGTLIGVAFITLRSLLTTLGGVGGSVSIARHDNDDGAKETAGSIAVRLFFKHRGVGSNDVPSGDAIAEARHVEKHGNHKNEPVLDSGQRTDWVGYRDQATAHGSHSEVEGTSSQDWDKNVDSGTWSDAEGPNTQAAVASTIGLDTAAPPTSAARSPLTWSDTSGSVVDQETKQGEEAKTHLLQAPVCGKLAVLVERAMRLPADPCGVSGTISVGSPSMESPPSTYVTFRWEEQGKLPLRSPFVLGAAETENGVEVGRERDMGSRQGDPNADGETITRVVENTCNPIFAYSTELKLTSPEAWGRICGPSAALVFRVWRRTRCSWWNTTQKLAEPSLSGVSSDDDAGSNIVSGARFGDKLIGSAVVGLEVLRGAMDGEREGVGLAEIDGWYHVLDDLQRPQGQLKVWVRPEPTVPDPEGVHRSTRQRQTCFTLHSAGHGYGQPFGPTAQPPPPLTSAKSKHEALPKPGIVAAAYDSPMEEARDRPRSPPLHDTETHLRAVHALLDSLPPEFRSSEREQAAPPSPSFVAKPAAVLSPTLTSRPHPGECVVTDASGQASYSGSTAPALVRVREGSGHAFVNGGYRRSSRRDSTPSVFPELQRLLSSLDKVDRRLFALVPGGGGTLGETNDAGGGCERLEDRNSEDSVDAVSCRSSRSNRSIPWDGRGGEATASLRSSLLVGDVDRRAASTLRAASTIQNVWRKTLSQQRRAGVARVQQEAKEAAARRERERNESAATIQVAYRRARARHRLRAMLEERRRWVTLQQRRSVACRTLERAWKAFECRRRGKRELAAAYARAAAAAAETQRRSEQSTRAAIVIQKLLRGGLSRRTARRLRNTRAESSDGNEISSSERGSLSLNSADAIIAAESLSMITPAAGGRAEAVPQSAHRPSSVPAHDVGTSRSGAKSTSFELRPLPRPAAPSTFYNQLSQDPRRAFPLPDAHIASSSVVPTLATTARAGAIPSAESRLAPRDETGNFHKAKDHVEGILSRSERFGTPPSPAARGAGVVRPPRFADLETARIARIMKGNLQHWAGVRSLGGDGYYSSSDDLDL